MTEFENELRSALRREQPPAGFSARVLARAERHSPRQWGWMAAAAAIAAGLLLPAAGFEYRQYQGRKARRELLLAIDIAGSKLNLAQKKVSDFSRRTIHE